MKQLALSQMEVLEGGGFWSGFTCGLTVLTIGVTGAAVLAATGPLGAVAIASGGAAMSSALSATCAGAIIVERHKR